MATFYYRTIKELEPRPGVKYATRYYKQSPEEYERLKTWLVQIAEEMLDVANHDPAMAEWMLRPQADFKKSTRRDFYTVQELITDLVQQVAQGKDIPHAMIGRWNRLCSGTPWEVHFEQSNLARMPAQPGYAAWFA
jgi:hypothetical protein